MPPPYLLRLALEIVVIVAIVYVVWTRTELRQRLGGLERSGRWAFGLLLGSWTMVQMVDRSQYDYPQETSFYPLTRFAMYASASHREVARTYRFEASDAPGHWREINATELFRPIGLPPFDSRMQALIRMAESTRPADQEQARTEIAGWLQAVYRRLGDVQSREPRAVRIVVVDYALESMVSAEPLVRAVPLLSWSPAQP